jgi:hypothetical protein
LGDASFTPIAVETTLTAPDWRVPPTVIDVLLMAIVSVGSVDAACAQDAVIELPATASSEQMVRASGRVGLFIVDSLQGRGRRVQTATGLASGHNGKQAYLLDTLRGTYMTVATVGLDGTAVGLALY